jgi:hypothetical protein
MIHNMTRKRMTKKLCMRSDHDSLNGQLFCLWLKCCSIFVSLQIKIIMLFVHKEIKSSVKKPMLPSLIYSIFRALVRCIKYIKIPTNALWFYRCNFIAEWSPAGSGHSCDHLQGGNNNNTNISKTVPIFFLMIRRPPRSTHILIIFVFLFSVP